MAPIRPISPAQAEISGGPWAPSFQRVGSVETRCSAVYQRSLVPGSCKLRALAQIGPPRWWAGLAALALATACVTAGRGSTTTPEGEREAAPTRPERAEAPPTTTTLEPTPVPLAEVDLDALPEPEPEPPADPPPFDEEDLRKIAAVQDIVAAAAAEHEVEPALINGMIWVESKFETRARGPAGAQGLMQLMPRTARGMAKRLGRKRRSYDPDFNIHAGTLLLHRLLLRFDGDLEQAIAAYNRGIGAVAGWARDGEPMPEGARRYVDKVLRAKAWFEHPIPGLELAKAPAKIEAEPTEAEPEPAEAEPAEAEPAREPAPESGCAAAPVSRP